MNIKNDVYASLLSAFDHVVSEQGGILGERDGKIVAYFHDTQADRCTSRAIYRPDFERLNAKIREWAADGIAFAGIIHSHPNREDTLSDADMVYIRKVFDLCQEGTTLYFPVMLSGGIVIPYAITKKKGGLSVVREEMDLYIT